MAGCSLLEVGLQGFAEVGGRYGARRHCKTVDPSLLLRASPRANLGDLAGDLVIWSMLARLWTGCSPSSHSTKHNGHPT